MEKEEFFNKLLKEAKEDPNIVGFILYGSRGMGNEFVHKESDYDIMIIVKDNVAKFYDMKYRKIKTPGIDINLNSISDVKKPIEEWERDMYARIKVLVDKQHWIVKHTKEISKIPKKEIDKYLSGYLDGFINHLYRSLKCWRGNDEIGARLEANREIETFMKIAFGVHERKTVPYYKYLVKDLKKHPLKKFAISSKKLLNLICKIIDTADVRSQQKLLILTEKVFRKEGYGYVFDGWEEKLDWMKKFKK
jgi:predicted nucleotidyltransferase